MAAPEPCKLEAAVLALAEELDEQGHLFAALPDPYSIGIGDARISAAKRLRSTVSAALAGPHTADEYGCPDARHHGVDCPGDQCRHTTADEVGQVEHEGDLREQIAETLHYAAEDPEDAYPVAWEDNYARDDLYDAADALIAGPLAPLLAKREEAISDEEDDRG